METQVALVKEYRFVLTLRGRGLSGDLADTDPQVTGKAPLAARALTDSAALTATHVQNWLDQAREVLRDDTPANMVTLRGFGRDPQLPKFKEIYKLRAACIAEYPMYKGVARLVGMDVLDVPKKMTPAEEFQVAVDNWDDYDFFFIHIKPTDSLGEDGNWEGKKQVIETVDQALPTLLAKSPEVLVVTGDHSTPARLKSHSWHPVPTLISAPATQMADRATRFGEREAQQYGGLGHISAQEIMPLAMAHALRLGKFGA